MCECDKSVGIRLSPTRKKQKRASNLDLTNLTHSRVDAFLDRKSSTIEADSEFLKAAKDGDSGFLKGLLKLGADSQSFDEDGNTGLHLSAKRGHDEVVKMLLDQGVDINIRNKQGWTALMNAAILGKKSTITLLIEAGADIDLKNDGEDSALHDAVRRGRDDIVKILLDSGINPNIRGENERTALFIAVLQNQVSTLNILLDVGADITCKDVKGDTILHKASCEGNNEILKILLERGIEVNVRGEEEKTAVMKAVLNGHQSTLKYLIKARADIRCKDVFGNTALHLAATMGRASAVNTLLSNGCEVNTRGHRQKTALMLAAEQGQGGVVTMLLDMGARLDLKDNRQRTAFEIIIDKKMLREREGIIDSMMKKLKGKETYETYDEKLEEYKIIQKVKAILPPSEGLRDCIKSVQERFKWSKPKYLAVLCVSFLSIILRCVTYGLDVYTDLHFSLSLFGQADRNFSVEIGNCRSEFDDMLTNTIQTCQKGVTVRQLHSPNNIDIDTNKCLRQIRTLEKVGVSCFNIEQRFDTSSEWNTAAIITLAHCGALPFLVSLIIWLSQQSFKICNLKAFLRFPHSLPAVIYQFHYTRKLIDNYAKDRKGEDNKWFFEVNKTKWIEKLRKNESLLNLSHMIEATTESSFQFWFQTIFAFPTILLSLVRDDEEPLNLYEFVNIRMLSILFSFGTFAFTFYNIRYKNKSSYFRVKLSKE